MDANEQDTERTYRVYLVQGVSTVIEVEAANHEAAIEGALEQAPSPTNSTNHGIDPAGEWVEVAVELDGEEVWSEREDKRALATAASGVSDAAAALVAELDGTFRPVTEVVESLRAQEHPATVDPKLLADLVEAVSRSGANGWWN